MEPPARTVFRRGTVWRAFREASLYFPRSVVLLLALLAGSCKAQHPAEPPPATATSTYSLDGVIPKPESAVPANGSFSVSASTKICVEPWTAELNSIGVYLAERLNTSTGYAIQVVLATGNAGRGNILLTTVGADPSLGEEGYELTISSEGISLVAFQNAGLFRGVQTIRQLLPPSIESLSLQAGPWGIAAGIVRDRPRFPWRGTMLDVARHFFTVQDVKRYLDLIAYYKMNRFHLHLTDDQGWRIEVNSWANLASYGGSTKVGGGPGGYFTQADYSDIVAYAQTRYITVVPEIDMPGHTNAALASYALLNCSGIAPPLYTGIGVGFSVLCTAKETTYAFVADVIREISALTPGPYIHIGGDEASTLSTADYIVFVERVQAIVQSFGKQLVGWEEISRCHLVPTSIAQHWNSSLAQRAAQQGAKVIMSPASRAYLDMKYNASTTLGQDWAGYIEVQDAYSWDPIKQVPGLSENDILGVEAPLWTETIQSMADIEAMAFPRLAGFAEIGWSTMTGRSWDEYKSRLASHGPRLTAMGVDFYRSPQVPWE